MPAADAPTWEAAQVPLHLKLVTRHAGLVPRIDTAAHTVIFTHIPKTAGTTLDHIMHAAAAARGAVARRVVDAFYAPLPGTAGGKALAHFEALGRDQLATIDYLTGHLPYGVHARIPRACLYVTLLRNPAAQLLSHFLFGVRRGRWTRETAVEELMQTRRLIDNPQTRQIAGMGDRHAECTPATLAAALANLQSAYAIVGITERFDEVLKALITLLRWPDVAYSRYQVARPFVDEEVSERIAAAAERYCEFDRALYDAAAGRPMPWSAGQFEGVAAGSERQRSVLVVSPLIRFQGRPYGLLNPPQFDNILCRDIMRRGGSIDVV